MYHPPMEQAEVYASMATTIALPDTHRRMAGSNPGLGNTDLTVERLSVPNHDFLGGHRALTSALFHLARR